MGGTRVSEKAKEEGGRWLARAQEEITEGSCGIRVELCGMTRFCSIRE